MHGWSPRVMRSNSGHSIVEAKMLDFQVLVLVTSFCFSPPAAKLACCCKYSKFARVTHQRSGETEACNSIAAWVREPVTGNSSISDCDFAERTQWTSLHQQANRFFATWRGCLLQSSSLTRYQRIPVFLEDHEMVLSSQGANLRTFGHLSTFLLHVQARLCKSSECCCCPLYPHRSKGLGIPSVWDYIADILLLSTNRGTKTNVQLQNGPDQNISCGAAILYIRNLIMLERMVDRCR